MIRSKKATPSNFFKVLFTGLALLSLSSIFVALGIWQLDRAASLKELQKPYVEKPVIELSSIAKPDSNLSGDAVNRIVTFTGRYVAQFDAPNQRDDKGQRSTWIIGLVEVDGGGAILVARSDKKAEMPKGTITIEGRLMPRQFDDRSDGSGGSLRRIDPALIVAQYSGSLYDGFVLASSEKVDGQPVMESRIDLKPAKATVPGYYWQHISYVVIWWLMALVVLFLPFYSRWRAKQ